MCGGGGIYVGECVGGEGYTLVSVWGGGVYVGECVGGRSIRW